MFIQLEKEKAKMGRLEVAFLSLAHALTSLNSQKQASTVLATSILTALALQAEPPCGAFDRATYTPTVSI